jgi:predicted small lipoprotein YifL
LVQEFKVGHYNRCMLKVMKILVTVHALVAGAAMLTACGQKSALVLPGTPESVGRATLPQTLKLWPQSEAAGASAKASAPRTAPSGDAPPAPLPPLLNSPAAPVAPAQ